MNQWDPEANEILANAAAMDSAVERMRYIETACGDRPTLKQRVQSLLDAHLAASRFLASSDKEPDQETLDGRTSPESQLGIPDCFRPGQQFAGHFVIREIIGHGGMGLIALAEQTEPIRRKVAVKIIRPDFPSPDLVLRFEQERKVLALMQHPHIAKVLEAGYVDATSGCSADRDTASDGRALPYLVMEFIDGQPINEYCDRHCLGIDKRLQLMRSVCLAVQHAHSKGIIHRDLKPSNILIEQIDGSPSAKIIDFGVAKSLEWQALENSIHTGEACLVGSIDYMSPEQASFSSDIDTRTDIYSLGAVFYELITGHKPLRRNEGEDLFTTLKRIQDQEATRPSVRIREVSDAESISKSRGTTLEALGRILQGELEWIVSRAMEKDRDRRYQTANELADDIERYLEHRVVSARAPSTAYRMSKLYQRHRVACLATMAIVILLLLGSVGTAIGFIQASGNARRAEAGQQQIGQMLNESYLDSAATAVQRGQWEQAIESLERFRPNPTDMPPVAYYLLKLEALNGLNRLTEMERLVEQMTSNKTGDESQTGQVLLWQAEMALANGDQDRHLALVREALTMPLPKDDEHYARSLIADTTPDSIARLQDALAINPFHHRANLLLPIMLVSLGRFEEARAQIHMARILFPRAPLLIASDGAILALEGRADEAIELLERHQPILTDAEAREFRTLFDCLDELQRVTNQAVREPFQSVPQAPAQAYQRSQQVVQSIVHSHSLRLPLGLQNNLASAAEAIGSIFFQQDYRYAVDSTREMATRHPDGLLFYLAGAMLAIRKQWPEADREFEQALAHPSCFSAVRFQTLHALIMTRCAIDQKDPMTAPEEAELAELIAQRLADPEISSRDLGHLSKAAVAAGDLNLARSIIQKALDADPEMAQLNLYQAQIEQRCGNRSAARAAAEKALRLAEESVSINPAILRGLANVSRIAKDILDQTEQLAPGNTSPSSTSVKDEKTDGK